MIDQFSSHWKHGKCPGNGSIIMKNDLSSPCLESECRRVESCHLIFWATLRLPSSLHFLCKPVLPVDFVPRFSDFQTLLGWWEKTVNCRLLVLVHECEVFLSSVECLCTLSDLIQWTGHLHGPRSLCIWHWFYCLTIETWNFRNSVVLKCCVYAQIVERKLERLRT